MDHPTGTIQSVQTREEGIRAIVEVDPRAVCPRCASGKGCGAGLFGGSQQKRTVEALVVTEISLRSGDSVELRLAPAGLLGAAGIVYGLPLLGALLAAGVAWFLQLSDAAAAVVAVLGLISGFMIGRWRLARVDCIDELVPTVEKKLHNASN